jgi:myo-inositol-1(or 4)-monophosphatase
MINIAVRAARRAGDIISRNLDRTADLKISHKTHNDYVTDIDRQAEAAIIDVLQRAYPTHSILAEESGMHGDNDFQWIIDPLDGTTNYLHGYPQFAVSIALRYREQLEQGVIYDPITQELFTATRGQGAYLNNRRIRVSNRLSLEGALLGTGFPVRQQISLDEYLSTFRAFYPMTSGIRRAGAAALDLAYVACGRLDGFWEFGLKPWDLAAGALLIQEAGGIVSDMRGQEKFMDTGHILAAGLRIHKEMLTLLAPLAVVAAKD